MWPILSAYYVRVGVRVHATVMLDRSVHVVSSLMLDRFVHVVSSLLESRALTTNSNARQVCTRSKLFTRV